jgi:hypothetical protein
MRLSLACLGLLTLTVGAGAAAKAPQPGNIDPQRIAEIQEQIGTIIELEEQENISFAEFLALLEAKLPREKKITLRIDKEAFGKELPRIAGAPIKHFPHVKNVTLERCLRMALTKVRAVEELDYAFRTSGVVITRPRLAAHLVVYSVGDVLKQIPQLLPKLKQEVDIFQDLKPTDGPALLVRLLTNSVDMQPWETVQILNGTRLVVSASPRRHAHISDLIFALRRLADNAVVMNARLYEVDRTFYTKQIAPLFARDEDSDERPTIVRIDGKLLRKITKQKLVLEREETKIRPAAETPFLSHQTVFCFDAGPLPGKEGGKRTGSGTAGVSFKVRPLVSPDMRYLRLEISQEVAQLVGINKTKMLDVATGKDVEVESANVRKSSLTGTVQIPDTGPILMPVSYRPPGKGNEDKVWLLVARPFIWIEEEVAAAREGTKELSPQSIWDSEVPKDDEKPAPVKPVRLNRRTREILQAIITDVLTNPDFKDARKFYGTAKDKTFTLVDGKLGWPKKLNPETHGYKLVEVPQDPFVNPRRVLGIELRIFDLKRKQADLGDRGDEVIEICLFNAGGSANGGVMGGCTIHYVPKRVNKRWTVECIGAMSE